MNATSYMVPVAFASATSFWLYMNIMLRPPAYEANALVSLAQLGKGGTAAAAGTMAACKTDAAGAMRK